MKKPEILYVDDEVTNRVLFELNLGNRYAVYTADSGNAGLGILSENPHIKVVVCDMKMPKMSGIEFIEKAKEKYKAASFYILTGFEITEEIQRALVNGLIKKYFRKPYDLNGISGEIAQALQ